MSKELRRNRESSIGQREFAVGYLTKQYEQPLLTGLWNRWGTQTLPNGRQRGWLVCDPAVITLSRILNAKAGIPIIEHKDSLVELADQEHLTFPPFYYYDPPNGRIEDRADHQFLTYFNGKGSVTHIDVTYGLTWGGGEDKKALTGEDNLRGAIIMRRYPVDKYAAALRDNFHLVQHPIESDFVREMFDYYNAPVPTPEIYAEFSRARHTNLVTDEPWPEDEYQRTGPPLANFIRTFVPGWNGIRQ